MRDIVIVGLVVLASIVALRRPWVGIMAWTWISIMNPHRYAWGFAYDAPLAMMTAVSTLIGLLITSDRRTHPFKGAPPVILALFMAWMTLSWQFGFDPAGDYPQWDKVMKINFMVLVSLVLLHSKQHVFALIWVCAGSLALLGAKGGLFTILTAGSHRVWGPAGTFIGDNNHFALALIMTIPLLRFLQQQLSGKWGPRAMTVVMILVAAAALGSHSRGALLALSAMALFLWWRGGNRLWGGVAMVVIGAVLVVFMPDHWSERMGTIRTFEEDSSAMGRISAWWVSWGIAKDYVFGSGFNIALPWLFERYSPINSGVVVAHSIYFQILGHHGFIGLALFLALWISTWWVARCIRKEARDIAAAGWCVQFANMAQVSLVGYAVGGAFLNLAYFDLPYNLMAALIITRAWVRSRGWEREPVYKPGWLTLPGLAAPATPANGAAPGRASVAAR